MAAARMRINPDPVTRAEFDKLLAKRESLREQLRQVDISITIAKARGVEPVTRENVTNEITMGYGRRAPSHLQPALNAWHRNGDEAALAVVIAALNEETKP